MQQKSSEAIDRIVIRRVLLEKLGGRKPEIQPEKFTFDPKPFEDFAALPREARDWREREGSEGREISFRSAVASAYEENNRAASVCYPALGERAGSLIFVHGLFEEDRRLYRNFFALLNQKGWDVYHFTLPFHYERKPHQSHFSGEFFWSADLPRTLFSLRQAAYDLCQFYHTLEQSKGGRMGIVGYSMGGAVSLLLASLDPTLRGIFLVSPVVQFDLLIWLSEISAPLRQALIPYGFTFARIQEIFLPYEPMARIPSVVPPEKIALATALYDQIVLEQNYASFIERSGLRHIFSYPAGHLNILRTPTIVEDILGYFC